MPSPRPLSLESLKPKSWHRDLVDLECRDPQKRNELWGVGLFGGKLGGRLWEFCNDNTPPKRSKLTGYLDTLEHALHNPGPRLWIHAMSHSLTGTIDPMFLVQANRYYLGT